ncbi:amino acid racemase [Stappia sp.]|uniref:aspartate/glutamate racemase family protein n=1 Tax=Stappia sp. TaxID=1870903 RepID=UPI0032D98724
MQKIGLIGGLSWVSTAEYYRQINQRLQRRLGGVASPRIVLESVNRQAYVDAVIDRRDEAAALAQILDAARAAERAGADFLVITCNDVHRFVPDIQPHLSIPFLHIADATADAIERAGLTRVGLLGVRKTMEGSFYGDILGPRGIAALVPDEPDRSYVHDRIYDEMVHDVFTDATRAGYQRVIGNLASRGAQGIVLACTEIPLLLSGEDVDLPTFSTTDLHCAAAIDRVVAAL